MNVDDFLNYLPNWLSELRQRAEGRDFSLKTEAAGGKSCNFQIEGKRTCAVGRTHNTRQSTRGESYINLNYSDELRWKEQQDYPFPIEDEQKIVDVFAVVIDHRSPGEYQQEHDDFLVLDEEILEEIPESGNKAFRITSTGYRDPFDRHQNSWKRLFENVQ